MHAETLSKLAKRQNIPHLLASDGRKKRWKQKIPDIISAPESFDQLQVNSVTLQLKRWLNIPTSSSDMLSPLIITSDPFPSTNAASFDLIAVHVSSKEYHSVRAHNPWDDQARIIASSPNLLLATKEIPSQRPQPTSCIVHSNVHCHVNLPRNAKEVTPDQVEIK